VGPVSQKLRPLCPDPYNVSQYLVVVILITVVATIKVCIIELLAHITVISILQERNHARFPGGENPFALHACALCLVGSTRNNTLRQTLQVSLVINDKPEAVGLLQDILAEFDGQ